MFVVIGICIVVVVAIVVVASVRTFRSRSAKSDWLGELSEIRRSSLGDDEEVTGALEAVTVEPEPSAPDSGPVTVEADRIVDDADDRFAEFTWDDGTGLRVETTRPADVRVLTLDDGESHRILVDLSHGTLWYRSEESTGSTRECVVRGPTAWVTADGVAVVLLTETDWSYVMCLAGSVTVRNAAGGRRMELRSGQVGRFRGDTDDHDLVDIGVDALESEGAVRRQRRLDEEGAAS